MRPIPAPRIGDSHGILRAIEERGRLRTDELVTEFSLEQLFPPELENAVGRMRHFISYARAAGLVKEDRGVVELTEVGKRYVRAGNAEAPFDVSEQQAEWLRRQLREKHMTDSIFHGMAIGLSLLASAPPGSRVSTLDFGRAIAYLGRAGWDNENTFQIQGERYLTLLTDVELIDAEHRLTPTGEQMRSELTLPVHMSLLDIATQLNPGGAEAVASDAEAEFAPKGEPEKPSETGYHDVVPGSFAPSASNGEGALPAAAPEDEAASSEAEAGAVASGDAGAASSGPPVPPADIWETAAPEDATKAIPAARPPLVPRVSEPGTAKAPAPAGMPAGDPLAVDTPTVITPGSVPATHDVATAGGAPAGEEAAAFGGTPADVAAGGGVPASGGAAAESGASAGDEVAFGGGAAAGAGDEVAAGGGGAAAQTGVPAAGDVAALGGAAAQGVPAAADVAALGGAAAAAGVPAAGDLAALGGAAARAGVPAAGDLAALGGAAARAGVLAAGDVAPIGGAPAAGGDIAALGRAALAGAGALRADPAAFVDPAAIRAAAEGAGLRFPDSVYANLAAALAAGKHVLLTGAPGAGKTSLALAVARAAAQAGRANGATLVTASPDWDDRAVLVESAKQGRWVIFDELDRARLDGALGELSSFLAGLPVQLAGGEEAAPDGGWRIVATAARAAQASAALLRRFAVVEVLPPADQVLAAALNTAARGDATAAAAAARLLPLAGVAPLGAGVFIDAARHAAVRHAAVPADEATLARDVYAAYVAPLLGELDEDAARRVREILGDAWA